MKMKKYIVDHLSSIIVVLFSYLVIFLLLIVFRTSKSLMLAITFIFIVMGTFLLFINYYRKKKFYDEFIHNVCLLDKKYFVLETISKPHFYEGKILYQLLYEIHKSMIENVKIREDSIEDFKEYVEMWIHEVKIPISSLMLLCHNHRENLDNTYIHHVKKLDGYIDQILYYVRSNNTEQDFVIKEISLDKVIRNVALKNKDDLLENKINLITHPKKVSVYTDSKWLEFILNQIMNNSIKYIKEDVESYIKIDVINNKNEVLLSISDNGIGIVKKDLPYVFKKSFTGENGRTRTKSTGMGLYIADKLCKKLGHKISIESNPETGTTVLIEFGKNNFYKTEY